MSHKRKPSAKLIGGAIFLTTLCFLEIYNVQKYSSSMNYMLTTQEYVFIVLSSGANVSYSAIVYLLMLGDLNMENRSLPIVTKHKTINGIIRLLAMPLLFIILITVFTAVMAFPISQHSSGWTELRLLEEGSIEDSIISEYILANFNCYKAIGMAAMIDVLFYIVSSLICRIMAEMKMQYVGTVIYIMMVEWESIWTAYDAPQWFLSRCCTLNKLLRGTIPGHERESILRGIAYLLVYVVVLSMVSKIIRMIKANAQRATKLSRSEVTQKTGETP